MIIDFIIEDLMLNSYLQKNFHTLDYLPYYLSYPDHLKLNNIPKSSLLCKSITGKLKSHVLIKSNRGVIAPEDI